MPGYEEPSVRIQRQQSATILMLDGDLDSTTYLATRNAIVKAATDSPESLIVDIRRVTATSSTAWSVLTSSAWLVRDWPHIPISVVGDATQLRELTANGVTRYVPVHGDLGAALDAHAVGEPPVHVIDRARHTIARDGPAPMHWCRHLVSHTLSDWDRTEFIELARVVCTILVSNVIEHTDSNPDIRLEMQHDDVLVIAVSDDDPTPPVRAEDTRGHTSTVSGLTMLTSLVHHWGCTPAGDRKTVWAVIRRRNCDHLS